MARTVRHFHRCADCHAKTECFGQLESNHDGEPWIVCAEFHLMSGETNPDFICEACDFARQDAEERDRHAVAADGGEV